MILLTITWDTKKVEELIGRMYGFKARVPIILSHLGEYLVASLKKKAPVSTYKRPFDVTHRIGALRDSITYTIPQWNALDIKMLYYWKYTEYGSRGWSRTRWTGRYAFIIMDGVMYPSGTVIVTRKVGYVVGKSGRQEGTRWVLKTLRYRYRFIKKKMLEAIKTLMQV